MSTQTAGIPGAAGVAPRRSRVEGLVLLALAVAAAFLVAADVSGRVAGLTILLAVLVLPGWLVVDRLGVTEPFARYLLSLVLGGAAEAAACLAMVASTWWHPVAVGTVLLFACIVLLAPRAFPTLPGSGRRTGDRGGGAGDVQETTG